MRTIHILLIGKTGMGKSTLIRQMAVQSMEAGSGLLLLDPHGDLADEVATLVPRRRRNDVVLFDARDPEASPGLNPLRSVSAGARAVVVSGILATFKKLWPDNWGPRTEHLLRYALLALLEVRGATLIDARDMLSTEHHRGWVLKQVRDEDVLRFWVKEFTGYDKKLRADAVAAPLNKLGAFLASVSMRAILSKNRPVLDAEKCMARSRIVIARLSKGAIGEDGAHLLGGLLLGLFQRATMAREALPPEARTPFAIFVDEVGSFATKPFLELLAEARKYGVSITLATQSLAVMEPEVRAGILGNVGRLIAFRVGAEDALILEREFAGRFGPQSLMQLDVGERIVKDGGRSAVIVSAAA
jgi:energy-coupling factor transporter ATP-binding protein EcfA2